MAPDDRASFLLLTHYDGGAFAGWQRQPAVRTVQGELERALARICGEPVAAIGSGRTDAGVHARGQAVGVRVSSRWNADALRRATNAGLPDDVWIARSFAMAPEFHPRHSAQSRRYRYHIGTNQDARSPFRRRTEWALGVALDLEPLQAEAAALPGEHCFRSFAVRGTAPAHDDHRCHVFTARWLPRDGGVTFEIEANRFLHHMVRFLVGTMVEVARGRRAAGTVAHLLHAVDNRATAPPAPPQGLFLEQVRYPDTLYLFPT
jgi:tRNA pseudouridine38-40 synthase